MQQAQDRVERVDQCSARAPLQGIARLVRLQDRLGQFEVPVAELPPGEIVDRLGREIESIRCKVAVHGARGFVEACSNPAVGDA